MVVAQAFARIIMGPVVTGDMSVSPFLVPQIFHDQINPLILSYARTVERLDCVVDDFNIHLGRCIFTLLSFGTVFVSEVSNVSDTCHLMLRESITMSTCRATSGSTHEDHAVHLTPTLEPSA